MARRRAHTRITAEELAVISDCPLPPGGDALAYLMATGDDAARLWQAHGAAVLGEVDREVSRYTSHHVVALLRTAVGANGPPCGVLLRCRATRAPKAPWWDRHAGM